MWSALMVEPGDASITTELAICDLERGRIGLRGQMSIVEALHIEMHVISDASLR